MSEPPRRRWRRRAGTRLPSREVSPHLLLRVGPVRLAQDNRYPVGMHTWSYCCHVEALKALSEPLASVLADGWRRGVGRILHLPVNEQVVGRHCVRSS